MVERSALVVDADALAKHFNHKVLVASPRSIAESFLLAYAVGEKLPENVDVAELRRRVLAGGNTTRAQTPASHLLTIGVLFVFVLHHRLDEDETPRRSDDKEHRGRVTFHLPRISRPVLQE